MAFPRTLAAVAVLFLVLAGCTGGGGSPAEPTTTGAADPADGSSDGRSTDWCVRGQTSSWSNPETGEAVSMEVRGVVTRDGRDVCRAVWTSNEGDVRRIEMLFTEDGSYQRMVTYDENGEVENEFEFSGVTPTADGDASADGGTAADWCAAGSSMSFANPATGETARMEVQGIVERDGREVCKAVWETNQGEVRRMELYFDEDRRYQLLITYDENGEVVNRFRMGDSAE